MATFIGKPCKKGHTLRYSNHPTKACVECQRERSAVYSRTIRSDAQIQVGDSFGKLRVVGVAHGGRRGKSWLCRCACGAERTCLGGWLLRGSVTQCDSCKTAFQMSESNPYKSQATERNIKNLTAILQEATSPLTRSQLRAKVRMSEERLYDCISALYDNRRLKVGYFQDERTYALAA